MKPYRIASTLRKTASQITLLDVLTSGDPGRIGRYMWNRTVGQAVRRATRSLFLRK